MHLPQKIFLTGVPGSRWSGIAQHIESIPEFNTTDRNHQRTYIHNGFTGHQGAYFGRCMEFDAKLEASYLDQAWRESNGTRLIKSHDWAYKLDKIKETFPDDWIMLIYRPDDASYTWWKEAGGFNITYPTYQAYINDEIMQREISWQNQAILKFAKDRKLDWSSFTSDWVRDQFGYTLNIEKVWTDVQVAILK